MHTVALRAPDGHPLQGGYTVVTCDQCGCGFADVVETARFYESYYASLAKYAGENATTTQGPADTDPDWILGKADACAERVDRLLGGPAASILDVGCATGALLAAISRRGYRDLHGIDPSPDAVVVANSRPGISVQVGTFASLPSDLGAFDCICLTGVLEHLWDLDEALAALAEHLNPDGLIYVEVPDASRYLDPYVAPFEDFNTEHVNHLSFSCLDVLASRFGLRRVWHGNVDSEIARGSVAAHAAVAWRRSVARQEPAGRDDFLPAVLREYSARSAADYERIDRELEKHLGDSREFVLWGIGELSFKLLALPALRARTPTAFVDGNSARWGLRFDGVEVLPPTRIVPGDVPVVISSLLRADSIVASAADLGLPNPLVRLDAWRGYPSAGSN